MTRREWLNRVLGVTVAAAVAPLVDLTDNTLEFWKHPALQDVLPWRVEFPSGTVFSFQAVVVDEQSYPDGSITLSVAIRGATTIKQAPVKFTKPTVVNRNFKQFGELLNIMPPTFERGAFISGRLERKPMTFTVRFDDEV